MGCGVVLITHALRSAFVDVVAGAVAMHPKILRGFVAPDVVGDVLAVELDAFGVGVAVVAVIAAPRWLVAPAVPVVVVVVVVIIIFVTAPVAPVDIVVVVMVLLGGLLLLLLPRLRRVHLQLLFNLLHHHCLMLYLILIVDNRLLCA